MGTHRGFWGSCSEGASGETVKAAGGIEMFGSWKVLTDCAVVYSRGNGPLSSDADVAG